MYILYLLYALIGSIPLWVFLFIIFALISRDDWASASPSAPGRGRGASYSG
jgi:hypothetical protein